MNKANNHQVLRMTIPESELPQHLELLREAGADEDTITAAEITYSKAKQEKVRRRVKEIIAQHKSNQSST